MDRIELATLALTALDSPDCFTNGKEIIEGFFAVFNTRAGQSRNVVRHAETNVVYKYSEGCVSNSGSRGYLGTVELDGTSYPVRLPEFYEVNVPHHYYGEVTLEVAEFVTGRSCCPAKDIDDDLEDAWCDHAYALGKAIGGVIDDTHNGNYLITDDNEVVIFDFAM